MKRSARWSISHASSPEQPPLTGEAGVGKMAVVEGLALRIADGDVPEPLQNVQLWLLDIGMLQAGAGMKGELRRAPVRAD